MQTGAHSPQSERSSLPSLLTAADVERSLRRDGPPREPAPRPSSDHDALADTAWGQFLIELKRRHVYKVGAAYLAFLVVLIGVLGGLRDIELPLPETAARAILGVAVGGLPVALALSWMFDLRAGRIERTQGDESAGLLRRRVIPGLALSVSLVVAGLIWWGIQSIR